MRVQRVKITFTGNKAAIITMTHPYDTLQFSVDAEGSATGLITVEDEGPDGELYPIGESGLSFGQAGATPVVTVPASSIGEYRIDYVLHPAPRSKTLQLTASGLGGGETMVVYLRAYVREILSVEPDTAWKAIAVSTVDVEGVIQ